MDGLMLKAKLMVGYDEGDHWGTSVHFEVPENVLLDAALFVELYLKPAAAAIRNRMAARQASSASVEAHD